MTDVQFRALGDGTFEGYCPTTGQRARVRAEFRASFANDCARASSQLRQTHYAVGDGIARVTKALGIAPCTPCQARQAALNRMFRR